MSAIQLFSHVPKFIKGLLWAFECHKGLIRCKQPGIRLAHQGVPLILTTIPTGYNIRTTFSSNSAV